MRERSRRCRTTTKPDYGVFASDKFWGHVLPGSAAGQEPFKGRVERAWKFMQNMFFTPKEHAALAEAMVRLVPHIPAMGLGHSDESDASPLTTCG